VAIAGTGGFKGGAQRCQFGLAGHHARRLVGAGSLGRMRYARNAAQATYASAQADFEFARQSLAATTTKKLVHRQRNLVADALAADM